MPILLFPGRHLLTTRFQERYLTDHLRAGKIDEVVFAIASANQANSRYNPLPLEIRVVGIDRFARDVGAPLGVRWRIVEGAGMAHAYASEWNVANRFQGKAKIYRAAGEMPKKMVWPVTNMVLVGQK